MVAERKKKGEVGSVRYRVEYCSEIPKDENGDAIMDAAVYQACAIANFIDAKLIAWNILKNGAGNLPWEIVTIEKQSAEVDTDMLQHEGIRRLVWETVERWETTGDGEEPYRID